MTRLVVLSALVVTAIAFCTDTRLLAAGEVLVNGSFERRTSGALPGNIDTLAPGRSDLPFLAAARTCTPSSNTS